MTQDVEVRPPSSSIPCDRLTRPKGTAARILVALRRHGSLGIIRPTGHVDQHLLTAEFCQGCEPTGSGNEIEAGRYHNRLQLP